MPRLDEKAILNMAGIRHTVLSRNSAVTFSTHGNTLNMNRDTPNVWHTSITVVLTHNMFCDKLKIFRISVSVLIGAREIWVAEHLPWQVWTCSVVPVMCWRAHWKDLLWTLESKAHKHSMPVSDANWFCMQLPKKTNQMIPYIRSDVLTPAPSTWQSFLFRCRWYYRYGLWIDEPCTCNLTLPNWLPDLWPCKHWPWWTTIACWSRPNTKPVQKTQCMQITWILSWNFRL